MTLPHRPLPVVAFIGHSGSGKTTLLAQVIAQLTATGLRVAAIKRTHHDFDIDHPGKDSHTLRASGASQVLLAGPRRTAWVIEHGQGEQATLDELIDHLDADALDLVLVEGGKLDPIPKIEVWRAAHGRAPLFPADPHVLAVASDGPLPGEDTPRLLDLNAPGEVADFLARLVRTRPGAG